MMATEMTMARQNLGVMNKESWQKNKEDFEKEQEHQTLNDNKSGVIINAH